MRDFVWIAASRNSLGITPSPALIGPADSVPSNDLEHALARIDRITIRVRIRQIRGMGLPVLGAAGGVYEVYSSGQLAWQDVSSLICDSDADRVDVLLSLADHGLGASAGVAATFESVAGGLLMAGIGTGNKILTVYVPAVGLVVVPAMIAGEGAITYLRWQYGYVSDAMFRKSMRRLALQAGFTTVGGAVGGVVGTFSLPALGTYLGVSVGSGIGYGAASLTILVMDWWSPVMPQIGLFGSMTSEERAPYCMFLRELYDRI